MPDPWGETDGWNLFPGNRSRLKGKCMTSLCSYWFPCIYSCGNWYLEKLTLWSCEMFGGGMNWTSTRVYVNVIPKTTCKILPKDVHETQPLKLTCNSQHPKITCESQPSNLHVIVCPSILYVRVNLFPKLTCKSQYPKLACKSLCPKLTFKRQPQNIQVEVSTLNIQVKVSPLNLQVKSQPSECTGKRQLP